MIPVGKRSFFKHYVKGFYYVLHGWIEQRPCKSKFNGYGRECKMSEFTSVKSDLIVLDGVATVKRIKSYKIFRR